MDTDRYRLGGTAADRTAMPSWSVMSRCRAMSRAVDSVAVAVSPSKHCTPKRSLSTFKHHIIYHSREQASRLTVKEPPIHTPSLTHLTESQVAGSKVVWPLWDTVSFVYTGKGHRRELLSRWQTPSTWTTSTNQSLWGEEQHTHLAWFHLEKQ